MGEARTRYAQIRALIARRLAALHPPSEIRAAYERLIALIALEVTLVWRLATYEKHSEYDRLFATRRQADHMGLDKQALQLELAECA
jgi:hypothetical protein